MKNMGFIMALLAAFTFASCGGSEEASDLSDIVGNEDVAQIELSEAGDFNPTDCAKESANDWTNFLRIPYGASELDLKTLIGENSGGEYTDDSTSFVYYYKAVDRVPISVWANAKTTKIEMVFMEVVSYVQYFEEDLGKAKDQYDFQDCDMQWFGMTPDELTSVMGKPRKTEVEEDSEGKEVTNMFYDSDDYSVAINFKFYESQDNMCSSIMVNWFY